MATARIAGELLSRTGPGQEGSQENIELLVNREDRGSIWATRKYLMVY